MFEERIANAGTWGPLEAIRLHRFLAHTQSPSPPKGRKIHHRLPLLFSDLWSRILARMAWLVYSFSCGGRRQCYQQLRRNYIETLEAEQSVTATRGITIVFTHCHRQNRKSIYYANSHLRSGDLNSFPPFQTCVMLSTCPSTLISSSGFLATAIMSASYPFAI